MLARPRDLYRTRREFEGDAKAFGRRELNKLDKLRRISAASRRQFAEKGYDGTTLRDIAQEARVALGTIGFYAENKQDLVLLIFNEGMDALIDHATRSAQGEGSIVEALTGFFRPFYAAFSRETALYRILLRENVFNATSQHAVEFQRHRGVLMARLGDLIRGAEAAGELRPDLDADLAARAVFLLFFAQVRWWISASDPEVEPGLSELRRMFALLIDGMRLPGIPSARR